MRPRAVFLTISMATTASSSCDSSGKLKQAMQQQVLCGMQQWLPVMQRRQLAVDVSGLDCARRAAAPAQVRLGQAMRLLGRHCTAYGNVCTSLILRPQGSSACAGALTARTCTSRNAGCYTACAMPLCIAVCITVCMS